MSFRLIICILYFTGTLQGGLAFGSSYYTNLSLYLEDDAEQRREYILSLSKEQFATRFIGGLAFGRSIDVVQRSGVNTVIEEAMKWRKESLRDDTLFSKIAQKLINEWFKDNTTPHWDQIENLIYFLGRVSGNTAYLLLREVELKAKVRIAKAIKEWQTSPNDNFKLLHEELTKLYEIIGMAQSTRLGIEDTISPAVKGVSSLMAQLNYCTRLMLIRGLPRF